MMPLMTTQEFWFGIKLMKCTIGVAAARSGPPNTTVLQFSSSAYQPAIQ
jgi:hypothetical protein